MKFRKAVVNVSAPQHNLWFKPQK